MSIYNDKFNLKCQNAPVAIDIHRGFEVVSDEYFEEGIPHLFMEKAIWFFELY